MTPTRPDELAPQMAPQVVLPTLHPHPTHSAPPQRPLVLLRGPSPVGPRDRTFFCTILPSPDLRPGSGPGHGTPAHTGTATSHNTRGLAGVLRGPLGLPGGGGTCTGSPGGLAGRLPPVTLIPPGLGQPARVLALADVLQARETPFRNTSPRQKQDASGQGCPVVERARSPVR